LLDGQGRFSFFEAAHDIELSVFKITPTAREACDLLLKRDCVFRVRRSSKALGITRAALFNQRDIGLEPTQLCLNVVPRTRKCGEFTKLLLAEHTQFTDTSSLRRILARMLGTEAALVKLGDVEKNALVFGIGFHVSNLRQ